MDYESFLAHVAQHYNSIPWCAALLGRPHVIPFIPTSRLLDDAAGHSPTQDQLFRKTLNKNDSIPYCIGFYQDPFSPTSSAQASQPGPKLLVKSCSVIFDLHPGVNGYNGTAHGGLITSLIDEAMGSLIFINHQVQTQEEAKGRRLPPDVMDLNNIRFFTASMAVRFLKPLPTPQTVVVTASLNKIEGRKMSLDVTVEDKHHAAFAKCDGMWMSLPKGKM
ncbi:hypothetical protein BR93DRAFT_63947 [Coniochaeta sp. PMI_546]|nr:hypothetical protein BR93DRAFT_63947 [Coniochaeta sp. PMI_546]